MNHIMQPLLHAAGPSLMAAAGTAIDPLKGYLAKTSHEIIIRIVGQQTALQKIGWYLFGAASASVVVGGAAYTFGRVQERSRMQDYMNKRDAERGKNHERTYIPDQEE